MEKSSASVCLLAVMLPILFGCCCECPRQPGPEHALLIFVDKSKSVDLANPVNEQKIISLLSNTLDTMLRYQGDKIEVRFVHGQTAGATVVLNESVEEPIPCECDKSPDEIRDEIKQYQDKMESLRDEMVEDIVLHLKEQDNQSPVSLETDLLGTLEVAGTFLDHSAGFKSKTIIYFSDMVHSVTSENGSRRDYHAEPFPDKPTAETAGKSDLDWAKAYYKLQPKTWDNTKVLLWFPNTSMQATQNAEMKYYWKTLFAGLNPTIEFTTN